MFQYFFFIFWLFKGLWKSVTTSFLILNKYKWKDKRTVPPYIGIDDAFKFGYVSEHRRKEKKQVTIKPVGLTFCYQNTEPYKVVIYFH